MDGYELADYEWFMERLPEELCELVREYSSPYKLLRERVTGWRTLWESLWDYVDWQQHLTDEGRAYVHTYAHRSNLMHEIRNHDASSRERTMLE